jgi:hypothetical protein
MHNIDWLFLFSLITGLAGKTDMDQALVDQTVYTVNDLMEEFFQYVFQQDPGRKVCDYIAYDIISIFPFQQLNFLYLYVVTF